MGVLGQHCPCRLCSPPWEAGDAIGGIADEGQVVRNRFGGDSELLPHSLGVYERCLPSIVAHDLRVAIELRHVLVRAQDDDPIDLGCVFRGGCGQTVISFLLDHGPHSNTEGLHRSFRNRELGVEFRWRSLTGLVSIEHIVAEGFDDRIERDTDVRHPVFGEQRKRRCHKSVDGPDLPSIDGLARRSPEVVSKQLVGPIDQVHSRHTLSLQTR
jgi:hypothetical protein